VSHAIWQCALMRTSSRPVDMVFSIMGLFGVTLDPRRFHKDDRLGATIALAKKILDIGGNASWLGASVRFPPCNQLSSFPQFPQTSVAGKALVQTESGLREAAKMMDGEYPNSLGLARVVPAMHQHHPNQVGESYGDSPKQTSMTAVDGTVWEMYQHPEGTDHLPRPQSFVVLLGWFQKYYPGATLANGVKIRVMLIKEHAPQKFHLKSFISLDRQLKDIVMAWDKYTFSIGGPDALSLGSTTGHVKQEGGNRQKSAGKEMEVIPREEDGDDVPFHGSMRFAQYFYLTTRRYDIPRYEAGLPSFVREI